MIWHVVMWTIWSTRNNKLFIRKSTNEKDVEAKSIFMDWRWFLNKSHMKSLSFINWLQNPIFCLNQ